MGLDRTRRQAQLADNALIGKDAWTRPTTQVRREIYRFAPVRWFEAPCSMMAEMANPSASAISAQKDSSKAMRRRGSPNWLNGVKNSQKRNVIRKTVNARESPRFAIPVGHAGLTQRYR